MKQNAFFLLLLSCCFLGLECFHFVWQLARLLLFYLPLRFRLLLPVFPKSIWQIIFSGKENVFFLTLSLCLNVLLFCFVLNTCALPPSTNSRTKNTFGGNAHQILVGWSNNWMRGVWGIYGGEGRCILVFGRETGGKESTWETQA